MTGSSTGSAATSPAPSWSPCAPASRSLIFLFIVGLGEYAVALAVVVALLDVIPMIGATLGAVIVSAIGFATDVQVGIACIIFYLVYQQLENYVIYPRVMSKSVDIPGSVTVIAALVGASLLGVVGALLAIPTAAAILLLVRELVLHKQDTALAVDDQSRNRRSTSMNTSGCCECTQWPAPLIVTRRLVGNHRSISSVTSSVM